MEIIYLTTSDQRSAGAMGKSLSGEKILVFVYPKMGRRLYHTFFCEPLRIVALDASGVVVHDRVYGTGRFVPLPACCVVLEMAPETDYTQHKDGIVSAIRAMRICSAHAGGVGSHVSIDSLFFSLLAEAVLDVQKIGRIASVTPEAIRDKFQAWERGQIASSAGFILDFRAEYDIPRDLIELSKSYLRAENQHLDELHAASVAGIPWRDDFPRACLRCGRTASWRQVVAPAGAVPPESSWRYARPENHVPLCFRCADTLNFSGDPGVRYGLVWGLWGLRFEAFWRWHQAHVEGFPPEWDKFSHPLWPSHYGESKWATGSGAFADAAPRPPIGIHRNKIHDLALGKNLASAAGPGRNRYKKHAPVPYLVSSRVKIVSPGEYKK